MRTLKDTARAHVGMTYDGLVQKTYRHRGAQNRFLNEARILQHLERVGCPFVPRLVDHDASRLTLTMTACGTPVTHLGPDRLYEIFAELEEYGVRHDDPEQRNVTYRAADGRFCVIDFEFSTLLVPDAPQWTPVTSDLWESLAMRFDELDSQMDELMSLERA